MKKFNFNGRISFVDNKDGIKFIGSNVAPGSNDIPDDYNSFTYFTNVNNSEYKCMFGSKYEIEISSDDGLNYMLNKIDAIECDPGYISFSFKSFYSNNVTNTESKTIIIIVKTSNEIIKCMKYGMNYKINLKLSDREDAELE